MIMKELSIKEILNFLDNGVTRTTESVGYDPNIGSIEEKFELTKTDVKLIFQHPLLKNKKTKQPAAFILVDDVTENKTTPILPVKAYGARPVGSSPSTPEIDVNLTSTENTLKESVSEEVTSPNGNLTQDDLA